MRGVSLPSPIDLTRHPYNTGHTTVWLPCDRVMSQQVIVSCIPSLCESHKTMIVSCIPSRCESHKTMIVSCIGSLCESHKTMIVSCIPSRYESRKYVREMNHASMYMKCVNCRCRVKELISRRCERAQAIAATYKFLNELISDDVVFKVFLFLVMFNNDHVYVYNV